MMDMPNLEYCNNCEALIDETTCGWCEGPYNGHKFVSDHCFTPMGCICFYDEEGFYEEDV